MSGDIAERLREKHRADNKWGGNELCAEAADEIDRLRVLLLRAMQHVPLSDLYAEIDSAVAPLYGSAIAERIDELIAGSSHE
jgi:hypothetical protein